MTTAEIGMLALVLVFIGISATVSMSETALTHVSRFKALQLAEEGRRGAPKLVRLLEDKPRFLNVILLVNTLSNLAGTALATILAERLTGSWAAVVATLGMTILVFVFAESGPKTYAIQHPESVSLRIVPLITWLVRLPGLHPLTRALVGLANVVIPGKGLPQGHFVSEDDIRTMAQVGHAEGSIEEEEKEMIHSIFDLGDTVVREVMVPRPDMVGIPTSTTLKDVLSLMLENGFSRMPVFDDEDRNKIVGLVYAKDVMRQLHRTRGTRTNGRRAKNQLKDVLRKASFVPESKRVSELLREMQANATHMAIVVDEYGDVDGLVTMEDLLEEIVGEIADEYDREEPQVQPVDENTLLVNGRFPVDELSDLLNIELPNSEWDTVGGLMAGLLGQVPKRGQEVVFQGLRFRADRVQGQRIKKVLVTKAIDGDPGASTDPE